MNHNSAYLDPRTLAERVQWAQEHGGLRDDVGEQLAGLVERGIVDIVVERLLEDQLRPLESRAKKGKLPPFKIARLPRGDILLGPDFYGASLHLSAQWLTEHVQVLGRSGVGKSTLFLPLALQIPQVGAAIWLTDFYKKQLRRLRRLFLRMGINLVILRIQDWRWNLLQSNLRAPHIHLTTAVDIAGRAIDLPPRAVTIFRQIVHELYYRFGIFLGRKEFPTLFDVYAEVQKRTDLNASARDAILDRLGALLVSLTPQCGAWRVGWLPSDLARHNIVMEGLGAPETLKQLLIESTLYSIFQREVEQGVVNAPLRLFICLDDAQRFLSDGQSAREFSSLSELLGVVRGAGLGLCLLTQSSIGLPKTLTPNIGIRFFGVLGSAEDWQLAAESGLSSEQIAWAKLHLAPRGTFIGVVSSSSYREPFLFSPPLIQLSEPVEDAEVVESLKPLESVRTVFAEEFRHWQPTPVVQINTSTTGTLLNETELRFLKVVVDDPGKGSSHYARTAGIGGKRAAEIRQRLIEGAFVREHRLATGGRGRSSIVLEPLEAAFAVVK